MSTTASIPASLQGRHCNKIQSSLSEVGRREVDAASAHSALEDAGDGIHSTNNTGMLGTAQLSYRAAGHSYMDTMEAAEEIPYGANAHMEAHAQKRGGGLPSRLPMTGTCNWPEFVLRVAPNSAVGRALREDADAASGASTVQASAFSSR